MTSSSVLVEDNVSKHILSFTRENFLFTRTVCKAWHKNGADTSSKTNHHRAVDSVSTLDEALESGFGDDDDFFCTYLLAFCNNSHISVFQHFLDLGYGFYHYDVEYAAEVNRVDVLQFFKKYGATFDERILHIAVFHGHLETLEYLMGVDCPVDSVLIEFGDHFADAFKMRSMEIAVRDGRIDIVKQLRTVDYPFATETFEVALEGENIDMLKYLKEEAGEDFKDPYKTHFHKFVLHSDRKAVVMLREHGLVGDFRGAIGKDLYTVMLLEKYGCHVRPEMVDAAVYDHDLRLAKYLVRSRGIVPTSRAYGNLLRRHAQDEWFIESLNWLHDEAHCKLELGDDLLMEHLANQSPLVRQWFSDRE